MAGRDQERERRGEGAQRGRLYPGREVGEKRGREEGPPRCAKSQEPGMWGGVTPREMETPRGSRDRDGGAPRSPAEGGTDRHPIPVERGAYGWMERPGGLHEPEKPIGVIGARGQQGTERARGGWNDQGVGDPETERRETEAGGLGARTSPRAHRAHRARGPGRRLLPAGAAGWGVQRRLFPRLPGWAQGPGGS